MTLAVPSGQFTGLIGPSGAGKSTLIHCANRLAQPSASATLLGDTDLAKIGTAELYRQRRRIGMIFQEYALAERLTVMENVLSSRLGYVPFQRSCLQHYPGRHVSEAYRLLDRVDPMLRADKAADALSGGQRQRKGIARALAQEPELLLVDEPTASLARKKSRQIMRLFTEICEERGLPAIANIHDAPLAQQFMQRIVGLNSGRLVFDGKLSELTESVLTRIFGEEGWNAMRPLCDDGAGLPHHMATTAPDRYRPPAAARRTDRHPRLPDPHCEQRRG